MINKCRTLTLFFILAISSLAHAQGESGGVWKNRVEGIIYFDSLIEVKRDASLLVTETIAVYTKGNKIKRGIYRDFPTRYKNSYGNNVKVGFHVIEVFKNGFPTTYKVKNHANGKRIYIGDNNIFLKPDETYNYTIIYETNRQLGYFDNYDELYWNVTGHGWNFPIDFAKATVVLPDGAKGEALSYRGYTGRHGSTQQLVEIGENASGNYYFEAKRSFAPYEGLTIAISWPKGFVEIPSRLKRIQYFIEDNQAFVVYFLFIIILLLFYIYIWDQVGRDPQKGIIIPLYEPPEKISPAAMRYILGMKYDPKVFTSAVLSLAVKGYLRIEEEGKAFFGTYILEKLNGSKQRLTRGEKRMLKELFGSSDKLIIKKENYSHITEAKDALLGILKAEYKGIHFKLNRNYYSIAVTMTIGYIVAMIYFPALVGDLTLIPGLILVGLLCAIHFTFFHLLKAPTVMGRKVMDKIEGFRMYLSVAEKDLIEKMELPKKTPELFERYLPYAIALGVENKWAEKFDDVLNLAAESGESTYHPHWYTGRGWRAANAGNFSSSLSTSFSSAIASSSTPPGSSSGSGFSGGGFSGGGGGGGGGGGW